jgi:hypothetical protein
VVRETNSNWKEDRRFKKTFSFDKKMIGGPPPQSLDTSYGIPVVSDSETTTDSDAYKSTFHEEEEAFEGTFGCLVMRDLEPRPIGIPVVSNSETKADSDAYKSSFHEEEEASEGSFGCLVMRDLEPRPIEEMMYDVWCPTI